MSETNQPILAEEVVESRPSPVRDVANNTLALYSILFLVTGVLGVPLIFFNTRISTLHKWLLTIAVTLYTASLIGGVWLVLVWCWHTIRNGVQ